MNLIGEHTDYNDGFVCPMAIEPAVTVACRLRADGMVRLASTVFPDTIVEFSVQQKIERGEPTVGLGVTFEAATIVGVPLFDEDVPRLERELRRVNDRLSLLPKAVHKVEPVNANF